MDNFAELSFPDDFSVFKTDGSSFELRGSVKGGDMYLATNESVTPSDEVVRHLPNGHKERYIILDVQFIRAEFDLPDQQHLTVKRDFS